MSKAYLPASPEEMAEWDKKVLANLLPTWAEHPENEDNKPDWAIAYMRILRLIATIRERDRRIANLEDMNDNLMKWEREDDPS